MRLLLSSDALPDAPLDVLGQACRRRALAGLELSVGAGQTHGLDERVCPLHQRNGSACVPEDAASVAWLRLPPSTSLVMLMIWAGAAHQMGAGLLLPEPVPDPPTAVRLALVHGSDPAEARAAAGWARRHGAGTCWDVAPGTLEAGRVERVLAETLPTLAHMRLPGSGPEADGPGSSGTGALLGRLALGGYAGTIALVPSPGADLGQWSRWLLDRRGWGCGTAAEKQARRAARMTTEPRDSGAA